MSDKPMEPRAHARLGPSSASRWLRCPGSVNFIEELDEEEKGTEAADEGTILHSFCEDCLINDINPFDLVGERREYNGYKYRLTSDDAEMMLDGLDYIDDIPGKLLVEKRLDLSRWMPGQFGTSDVSIIGKRVLTVFDWKWGRVPVQAVDNDQLRIYALGVYDNFVRGKYDQIEKVRLTIWQPRASGGGGEWEIPLDDLLDFGKYVKRKAKATYGEDAARIAGKAQCQYCLGAKTLKCAEYIAFNNQLLFDDFDELDENVEYDFPPRFAKAAAMDADRRSYIVQHRSMIDKYLDRLAGATLDDAIKGFPTPGLKAVEGRAPRRKWKSDDLAASRLSDILDPDQVFEQKLISPAQAQRLVGIDEYNEKISRLVDEGEKKPTLVPLEDKRPALPTVIDMFDDYDPDE